MVGNGAHVASVRLTLDGGPTSTVATTAAFELHELLRRLVASRGTRRGSIIVITAPLGVVGTSTVVPTHGQERGQQHTDQEPITKMTNQRSLGCSAAHACTRAL
jgi:hypothetical protein